MIAFAYEEMDLGSCGEEKGNLEKLSSSEQKQTNKKHY